MPTPKQRWPYGAESARRESTELADETERALRNLERDMLTLKMDIAPMVPERYRKMIEDAYATALHGQIKQLRIKNLLVEAKHGTANGTTDATD